MISFAFTSFGPLISKIIFFVPDEDDFIAKWVTGLSLAATLMQLTITWFKFPEKVSSYRATFIQYSDLCRDLRIFLLRNHTSTELDDMEIMLAEKENDLDKTRPVLARSFFIKCITSVNDIPGYR